MLWSKVENYRKCWAYRSTRGARYMYCIGGSRKSHVGNILEESKAIGETGNDGLTRNNRNYQKLDTGNAGPRGKIGPIGPDAQMQTRGVQEKGIKGNKLFIGELGTYRISSSPGLFAGKLAPLVLLLDPTLPGFPVSPLSDHDSPFCSL